MSVEMPIARKGWTIAWRGLICPLCGDSFDLFDHEPESHQRHVLQFEIVPEEVPGKSRLAPICHACLDHESVAAGLAAEAKDRR